MNNIETDNKTNNIKRNMLYNTVGSVFYFVCQWLMIVLIVRVSNYDYYITGILSLATTVTASPANISFYSMRNYQVSDIDGVYNNSDYFFSRIVSCIFATLVCLVIVIAGGYSFYISLVILVYMMYKNIEAFADYYYGIEQVVGRMDYSGISMGVRGIGTLSVFLVSYYYIKDILISLILSSIISVIIIIIYDVRIKKRYYKNEKLVFNYNKVKALMIECFPLALVAFLNNYSVMIPRIFLEKYYGEEMMGYYSSVSSPTVIVQLLATNCFAPFIIKLTTLYKNGDKKSFVRIIKNFFFGSFVASILGVIVAHFVGGFILVMLFGEKIKGYVYLFVPIIVMTVFMATNTCIFSICTLMRIMKEQYVRGIIATITSFFASLVFVKQYGAMGVVFATMFAIVLQIIMQCLVINKKLNNITLNMEGEQ